jgi:hypothetical protein
MEIQNYLTDPSSIPTPEMKMLLKDFQSFSETLEILKKAFEKFVDPHRVEFDVLWGLVYLNLKVR